MRPGWEREQIDGFKRSFDAERPSFTREQRRRVAEVERLARHPKGLPAVRAIVRTYTDRVMASEGVPQPEPHEDFAITALIMRGALKPRN